MILSLDHVKRIYRSAIDSSVTDSEGSTWWQEVAIEVNSVIEAKTTGQAADIIAWWHHDWKRFSDTPVRAARRLRSAAKSIPPTTGHSHI